MGAIGSPAGAGVSGPAEGRTLPIDSLVGVTAPTGDTYAISLREMRSALVSSGYEVRAASVPTEAGDPQAGHREWCDTCLQFYTVNGCPRCAGGNSASRKNPHPEMLSHLKMLAGQYQYATDRAEANGRHSEAAGQRTAMIALLKIIALADPEWVEKILWDETPSTLPPKGPDAG